MSLSKISARTATVEWSICSCGHFEVELAVLLVYALNLKNWTFPESMVQAILNKENGDIKFHIMGNDHFDSTEEDFEAETLATRDLMETGFGRSVQHEHISIFIKFVKLVNFSSRKPPN